MTRIIAILISLFATDFANAQLMLDRTPDDASQLKVRVATEVARVFTEGETLRFELLDICFDGGSHGAFFKRKDGTEFVLFFPHPGYWSALAKHESKQPVAIRGKEMIEIATESPLQTRILELLANDIVDGKHDRITTLTLIRIRDCVLHRKPLAEIIDSYDPKTWLPRPERFGFDGDTAARK